MTSVRSRLAMTLVVVLVLPAIAVIVAFGVLAPMRAREAALLNMQITARAVALSLTTRCLALGETARALALQAGAKNLAAATDEATRRQPTAFAALIRDGRVVAASGDLPTDLAPSQLAGLRCTRRLAEPEPVTIDPPVLLEVVPATDATGKALGEAVVGEVLDATALDTMVGALAVGGDTAIALDCRDGRGLVHGVKDPRTVSELRTAAREAGPERIGPWQVARVAATQNQGCAVAAAVQPAAGGTRMSLIVAVLVAGLALAAWLVLRVADSLTRPILALTEAAERVARGDLTTRTQAQGSSELDRLSDAFNHMTDELQAKLGELESSRNLLRENVGRLGDTLQRTHDLDGLLMTVLGAAASATVSQRATVWLVEGGSVVARVSSPAGAPRPTARRLPLGTELAGVVAADGLPRRLGHGQGDSTTVLGGPALAAPLRRGHHVLGVIVVERDPEQPAFDADDEAMLVSLAGPAGIAVDNVMLHREAQRLSVTDPLTGAGNLRHMTTTLAREVERATRFQRPLSLLLLDLDFFKNVNDTYGHTVGDAVLRELARRLASCVREVDVVARYGGEEFVVVTPETDIEGAERLAARICEAVREEPFVVGDDVVQVTVSVGIASLPQHGSASGDLVRAADEGLYAAKHAGRDCYRVASSGEPPPAGEVTDDR